MGQSALNQKFATPVFTKADIIVLSAVVFVSAVLWLIQHNIHDPAFVASLVFGFSGLSFTVYKAVRLNIQLWGKKRGKLILLVNVFSLLAFMLYSLYLLYALLDCLPGLLGLDYRPQWAKWYYLPSPFPVVVRTAFDLCPLMFYIFYPVTLVFVLRRDSEKKKTAGKDAAGIAAVKANRIERRFARGLRKALHTTFHKPDLIFLSVILAVAHCLLPLGFLFPGSSESPWWELSTIIFLSALSFSLGFAVYGGFKTARTKLHPAVKTTLTISYFVFCAAFWVFGFGARQIFPTWLGYRVEAVFFFLCPVIILIFYVIFFTALITVLVKKRRSTEAATIEPEIK
ncbi:MAG: hypothetical protein FWD58_05240 [Firmicutes bacterium]|nr:hypothetical protein [Bacillota bacterium]